MLLRASGSMTSWLMLLLRTRHQSTPLAQKFIHARGLILDHTIATDLVGQVRPLLSQQLMERSQ